MEGIQPEKMMEILRQHGTQVTLEQARIVLEFMCKLASVALVTYFGKTGISAIGAYPKAHACGARLFASIRFGEPSLPRS